MVSSSWKTYTCNKLVGSPNQTRGNALPIPRTFQLIFEKSDMDASSFGQTLLQEECINQINNTRAKLKDVIKQATQQQSQFKIDISENDLFVEK
jgi:hypothetical protein